MSGATKISIHSLFGVGKDEQDWSDLVVQAPPLFIQEKVHPKVLIDDLREQSKETEGRRIERADRLCSRISTGCRAADAQTEFYRARRQLVESDDSRG